MNIWIYGPPGCGKTTYAEQFRKYFEMTVIHDDDKDPFEDDKTMNLHGNLILHTKSAVPITGFLEVYTYDEAREILAKKKLN